MIKALCTLRMQTDIMMEASMCWLAALAAVTVFPELGGLGFISEANTNQIP